ncbi:MAG: DUF4129 domain-containing protein [Actinomycetota bacterium]|nr:DUF4129 domain-containing protein [Actinomycetota bacterium]
MSGARKLLLSGAALTALLAFVAIASHAHRPGGGSGGGSAHSPTLVGDYLATIALIIMPIGAVLVVWGLANRRKQAALTGRTSWRRNLIAAGVISALLIVLVVTAENRQGRARRPAVGPTQGAILGAPLGAKGPRKAVKVDTAPPHRPRWQWLPVLVLGSLLLGIVVTTAAAVVHGRRNREALDEEAQLARALGEVLSDSLDDLRAERDPRKAVIRAYARMEQTFAAYGVPREEHETPLEYVARVLDSLRVSSFAVRRLVQLFERAKFSPHTIESSMKDDAIEALAGLRVELEYDRTEAA